MKLLKTNKKPSIRDKLPDGRFIYACPKCRSKTLCEMHAVPMEDGKYIYTDTKRTQRKLFCYECSQLIAVYKSNGVWEKVGIS